MIFSWWRESAWAGGRRGVPFGAVAELQLATGGELLLVAEDKLSLLAEKALLVETGEGLPVMSRAMAVTSEAPPKQNSNEGCHALDGLTKSRHIDCLSQVEANLFSQCLAGWLATWHW